jgi:hypothetical protein
VKRKLSEKIDKNVFFFTRNEIGKRQILNFASFEAKKFSPRFASKQSEKFKAKKAKKRGGKSNPLTRRAVVVSPFCSQ